MNTSEAKRRQIHYRRARRRWQARIPKHRPNLWAAQNTRVQDRRL